MISRRLRVLGAGFAGIAAIIALQAVRIMVVQHERWLAAAVQQQQHEIELPVRRGAIRSADGYLLAATEERYALQIDPPRLRHRELFVSAVSWRLGLPPATLHRRLKRRWGWLAVHLPPEEARAIAALEPAAVALVPDAVRVYPHGSLAAPLLGFVGREGLRMCGRSGLEYRFDRLLAGRPGRAIAVYDAAHRRLRLGRLSPGRPGRDLTLTLHARLQAASEGILEEARRKARARAAAAVVLEPVRGDVLALVSLPGFDPARPGAAGPERWRLLPVQAAWEPGSTVKPLVAAAALARGAVRPGERFDCRGHGVRLAGHWIRDHAPPGRYTLAEVVTYSSNAGMVQLAERLDAHFVRRAFLAFGFGSRTGLGAPGEAAGLLPAERALSRMSPAGFALGEELTVTPLQLALAYAAIANGGFLLTPRLLADDPVPPPRARVLDQRLARRLREILERVVTEGTGRAAAVPGFRVAGKTGTAQRAVNGRLADDQLVTWFAGFLPAQAPRVVIVVALVDTPAGSWASETAAPAFARIARAAARELGLVPRGGRRGGEA